jgi:hypothetical protein
MRRQTWRFSAGPLGQRCAPPTAPAAFAIGVTLAGGADAMQGVSGWVSYQACQDA